MKTVILEKVSKEFKIGYKKRGSTLKSFIGLFSGKSPKKTIPVLKEISFSLEEGETVGIIGDNGSGKSTLLRIIAGIYSHDSGVVETHGKIVSLINLGAGLKVRLTMRDNIYLLGALFGMSQKEVKKKMPKIVDFSGLKEFLDTQVYQFSEGMIQRLVFSIVVYANPKILLLDEVFEIGDEDFKKKSVEKIKELVRRGATAILVSHDMVTIERYCHRVICLSENKVSKIGLVSMIKKDYTDSNRKLINT